MTDRAKAVIELVVFLLVASVTIAAGVLFLVLASHLFQSVALLGGLFVALVAGAA